MENQKPALLFARRIDKFLEKAIPFFAPLGVTLGVLLPMVFQHIRPYIPVIFAVITLSGSLRLRARELGKAAASPVPILFFFFTAHVLTPLMVFFIARFLFGDDPDTIAGFVLLYSMPTAVTGFIWVSIFNGDIALSLAIVLIDTVLAPVVVPGTVRLLLGTSVQLNMMGMAVSLVFMIAIPTLVGVTINETSHGKIPKIVSPWLNPIAKFCMIMSIAANCSAVADQFRLDNARLWVIFPISISFIVMCFTLAKLASIAGRFSKERQITLFFATGLRNIGAAMTLGIQFFPPAAALPAVLGILLQQTTAVIMGRLLLKKIEKAE